MEFIFRHRIGLLAVLLLAVVCCLLRSCGTTGSDDEEETTERRFGRSQTVMRTPKKYQRPGKAERAAYRADKQHRKAPVKLLDEDTGEVDNGQYDEFSGHDREIAKVMDRTFWDDDMTNTLASAIEAAGSGNRELRAKAVEYAAWYGKDGMDALMLYMADPDEEIAEDARAAWVEGLRDIEDDDERAMLVAPLSKVLTDPDTIEGMLMSLNDLPNIAQMQVLIDIMDTGTDAAYEVASDHYTFMTGEDFTTVEAAQAWLDENWDGDDEEEDEAVRPERVADEAEADIDAAVEAAGLDKDKVLQVMADEAEGLGLTAEEYLAELDKAAEEAGMTRDAYIARMLKDNPAAKATEAAEEEGPAEDASEE